MNVKLIQEPLLEFGMGTMICPKSGLNNLHPYDLEIVRPEKIALGIIGTSESIDLITHWIESNKKPVSSGKAKLKNLFLDFPGFNSHTCFQSKIVYDHSYLRKLNNSDIEQAIKNSDSIDTLVENMIDVYLNEINFLTKNKKPDVILCVLNKKLTSIFISSEASSPSYDEEIDVERELEVNFRRLLKAKAMSFGVPIQLVRDKISKPNSSMQDPATIAWNFFTALYYKASGTPWALKKDIGSIDCYAGISFYKSRDKKSTQTSITQIFNEHGKGVILRGSEVEMKKGDLEPHLTEDQSFELINSALSEYYEALKIYPQRLIVHKSSNFNQAEIEGFKNAAYENNIHAVDLVTIMPTSIRMFRTNEYPPYRGTFASLDNKNYLLYTRGYVKHYETYPGQYIPNPIQIRLFQNDESPEKIATEMLGLTKMNWNNTQFDRKYPITIECSRKVGEIMKYLSEDEIPQIRYSFYM